MAKIRVYRDESDGERFPRLCMRCGQPTRDSVTQKFAWNPPWVPVLILAGLLPYLLVAIVTRKTMRIAAPMCGRHRGHWRVRQLYVVLGLFAWIAYWILVGVMSDEWPATAANAAFFVGIFGPLAWLISAIVLSQKAIRTTQILDNRMDLVNVHRDFADSWN